MLCIDRVDRPCVVVAGPTAPNRHTVARLGRHKSRLGNVNERLELLSYQYCSVRT